MSSISGTGAGAAPNRITSDNATALNGATQSGTAANPRDSYSSLASAVQPSNGAPSPEAPRHRTPTALEERLEEVAIQRRMGSMLHYLVMYDGAQAPQTLPPEEYAFLKSVLKNQRLNPTLIYAALQFTLNEVVAQSPNLGTHQERVELATTLLAIGQTYSADLPIQLLCLPLLASLVAHFRQTLADLSPSMLIPHLVAADRISQVRERDIAEAVVILLRFSLDNQADQTAAAFHQADGFPVLVAILRIFENEAERHYAVRCLLEICERSAQAREAAINSGLITVILNHIGINIDYNNPAEIIAALSHQGISVPTEAQAQSKFLRDQAVPQLLQIAWPPPRDRDQLLRIGAGLAMLFKTQPATKNLAKEILLSNIAAARKAVAIQNWKKAEQCLWLLHAALSAKLLSPMEVFELDIHDGPSFLAQALVAYLDEDNRAHVSGTAETCLLTVTQAMHFMQGQTLTPDFREATRLKVNAQRYLAITALRTFTDDEVTAIEAQNLSGIETCLLSGTVPANPVRIRRASCTPVVYDFASIGKWIAEHGKDINRTECWLTDLAADSDARTLMENALTPSH